jgi:hypothetical protein
MSENVVRRVMLVLPYKRHYLAIIIGKSVSSNGSTIIASYVVARGPSTEVVLPGHFEFSSFVSYS